MQKKKKKLEVSWQDYLQVSDGCEHSACLQNRFHLIWFRNKGADSTLSIVAVVTASTPPWKWFQL